MLTLKQCRQIDPSLNDLSDEDLQKVIDALYELAQLAFDAYFAEKEGSNFPRRVLVRSVPED